MRPVLACVAAAFLCLPLAAAGAQSLPPPSSTAGKEVVADDSIQARFDRDPACTEMTDGCQVCRRHVEGKAGCSNPGIACQPSGWRCKNPPSAGTDSGRAPPPQK